MALNQAIEETVQTVPDARKNGIGSSFARSLFSVTQGREALLPPWGTWRRLDSLRLYWYHDYNNVFKSAIGGLAKRVESTPWEIKADDAIGDYFQNILLQADFSSWEQFVSKLITDFSRYDTGAFVEIIAPGDPTLPPTGAITGVAILDPMRCIPTGDPTYPVIYESYSGGQHLLHRTRVIQFVDMPDSTTDIYGYGMCALSRVIATVKREILMGQYIETQLDDQPPPGVVVFNNVSDAEMQDAIASRDNRNNTDAGNEWGRTIQLFGIDGEKPMSVDYATYSSAPQNFDYDKYKNINVREIALGIGVDIQDIWELSSGGLGTGTQSKVLAQKSRGKALGRILKGIERVINQLLPEGATFEFKYADADEDAERAEIANNWSNTVTLLSDVLTPDEQRELLANQVEPIRDAITDEDGTIRRFNDNDRHSQTLPNDPTLPQEEETNLTTDTKEINSTRANFARDFREVVDFLQDGAVSKAGARTGLRAVLTRYGRMAISDGMEFAGGDGSDIGQAGERAMRVWRARQTNFVYKFINEADGLTPAEITRRVQLWINMSIDPLFYKGMELQAPRQMYQWVVNPAKEHCVTCLKLNGQVHMLSSYARMGLLPKSRALVCGGWQCGCTLRATDQPARGRLRGVRFVRGRKEHHHVH